MNIRYLRTYTNGSTANGGNYWHEISIYNTSGTKVSTNKTVTTNGSVSSESAGTIKAVTDNNTGTYCSLGEGNIYVQIDLGSIQNCNKVEFLPFWSDGRKYKNFRAQVSTDGSNWVTIAAASQLFSLSSEGLRIYLDNFKGLKIDDTTVSQKSTVAQYPYIDDTQSSRVYYDGTLVWQKVTALDFNFSGSTLSEYTGNAESVTIPSTYYTVTDSDGTIIFTSTAIGIGTSVTKIGDDACSGKTAMTHLSIPSSVKVIGARAFQFCYNLFSVSMGSTPTSIGYCAFALTNISTPSEQMWNAGSLGQGCFAFRNAWNLGGKTKAQAQKLVATNMGKNLSNGGYTGYGCTSGGCCTKLYIYKSSGSDATSCVGTIYGRFGNTLWDYPVAVNSLTSSNNTEGETSNVYVVYNTSGTCIVETKYNINGSTMQSVSTQCTHSASTLGALIDFECRVLVTTSCICEGTLITLADGSKKPIEQITHKDLLLVWNFETGSYDYQYPLVVGSGIHSVNKWRITLEDNSYIDITGNHDIYDPKANIFRKYGNGAIHELPNEPLYVLQNRNTTTYEYKKIVSIEPLVEETKGYCLLTGGTISAFANDIMIGADFLNHTGITKENKFPDSFAMDKQTCYTYDRFKKEIYSNSSKYIVLGLNLNYLNYYYEEGITNFGEIFSPFQPFCLPNKTNNKYICTIGILDKDILIESKHLEDEEITLPPIQDSTKTKWYVVGEYKYLNPGDTYKINFSTLIRSV